MIALEPYRISLFFLIKLNIAVTGTPKPPIVKKEITQEVHKGKHSLKSIVDLKLVQNLPIMPVPCTLGTCITIAMYRGMLCIGTITTGVE